MNEHDIQNIMIFCSNQKLTPLALLSLYTSKKFSDICSKEYDNLKDDKQLLANKVIHFFDPFPHSYMTDIIHHNNTCFLAASVWMFGSMRLLVRLLYYNRSQTSNNLKYLVKVIYPSYSSKKRPRLNNIHSCVLYNDYNKGAQDDLMMNLLAIINNINPRTLDRTLVAYTKSKSYRFIDNNEVDITKKSPIIISYFQDYTSNRLKLYNDYVKKQSNEYKRAFNQLFPRNFRSSRSNVATHLQSISKLEGSRRYKNITTFDRFCGLTATETILINQDICNLIPSYNKANKLYQYLSGTREISPPEYMHILDVTEHNSVQEFLDELSAPIEVEVENIVDDVFMITQTVINVSSDRAYLIIMIRFEGIERVELCANTKGVVKKVKNIIGGKLHAKLNINDTVTIGDNNFLLTAVGVKSGSMTSGHWWTLVRNGRTDDFIKYDDMNPVKMFKSSDIKKTGGIPAVLIYTNTSS
jgi:hypothetical protein